MEQKFDIIQLSDKSDDLMTCRIVVRTKSWDRQMIHSAIQLMIYVESLEYEISQWHF